MTMSHRGPRATARRAARVLAALLALLAAGCVRAYDTRPRAADGPLVVDARTDVDGTSADGPPSLPDAAPPPDPAAIYRSVGPASTAPLATGQGNALTVAGGVASFAGDLPPRVGVGDALQYDADDDGTLESLAFIHRRHSARRFTVAAADGGAPADTAAPDTDWDLHRAYTSLAAAGTGSTNPSIGIAFDTWSGANDLVTPGKRWHLACYADAVDREKVVIQGWASSASAYLRIYTPTAPWEVGVGQRHRGAWEATKYRLETPAQSNDLALNIRDVTVRVEGLQIHVASDGAPGDLPYAINLSSYSAGRTGHISHTLIRSTNLPGNPAFPRGIKLDAAQTGPRFYIWNNVIYDFGGGQEARGIELTGAGSTAYVYNNTIANVFPALYANDEANDRFLVRNTVLIACGGSCLGYRSVYSGGNNRGQGVADEGIGAPLSSDVITDYFAASDDFHLAPTGALVGELADQGIDLSADPDLAFRDDVDGAPRQAPWDIGADER